MPGSRTGKAYKLSRPSHGPYRVITALDCRDNVRSVDKPNAIPIRVALNSIRHCPEEIPDTFWPQKTPPMERRLAKLQTTPQRPGGLVTSSRDLPPGEGRPDAQEGEMLNFIVLTL